MNATEADPEFSHPPLARDALGNLVPVPAGTTAWRICRQTTGRPRVLAGPDGQPMRFPLAMTVSELVDLCGPDNYRVYALDEVGEVLGHVTTINAPREPRNSNEPDGRFGAAPGAAPTTDLRYALEAITHIARINGEALRAVTDAQADWVKTLAMAKGLPRNVAYPMVPPPRNPRDDDDDDEGDEGDDDDDDEERGDEPAGLPPTEAALAQFLTTVTPFIPSLLADWRGKKSESTVAPTSAGLGMAHLARIQQLLDPREREFLAILLADPENGDEVATELEGRSVADVVALIRAHAAEGQVKQEARAPLLFDAARMAELLRERAPALLARLSAPTQARLMRIAPRIGPRLAAEPQLLRRLNELVKLDDDAAAAWLETNIGEIERVVAS